MKTNNISINNMTMSKPLLSFNIFLEQSSLINFVYIYIFIVVYNNRISFKSLDGIPDHVVLS